MFMEEEEGSIAVASMEEEVRPPGEAQQWLVMVFVNLLGEVVKVVNGGDHSERERERERRTSTTIMHKLTVSTINPDDLNTRSSKSKANLLH